MRDDNDDNHQYYGLQSRTTRWRQKKKQLVDSENQDSTSVGNIGRTYIRQHIKTRENRLPDVLTEEIEKVTEDYQDILPFDVQLFDGGKDLSNIDKEIPLSLKSHAVCDDTHNSQIDYGTEQRSCSSHLHQKSINVDVPPPEDFTAESSESEEESVVACSCYSEEQNDGTSVNSDALEQEKSTSEDSDKPGSSSEGSEEDSEEEWTPGYHNVENDGSDGESIFDSGCFEAHFLDEEQHGENFNAHGGIGAAANPDADPDDPQSSSEEDSEGSDASDDESDEDGEEELANFRNGYMNVPVVVQNNLRKGDVILLELANAVRHNKTFESVLDTFRNLNQVCGNNFFPISKNKLWGCMNLNKAGIKSHVYCGNSRCGRYLGLKEGFGEFVECHCGYRCPVRKAKFFVMLDFRSQLKRFLKIPGIWNKLQFRHTRVKQSPTAIEDVFDSECYKRLVENGGPLASEFNFSYVFSTDGCVPYKKGKIKMWPIFIRINELPPDLRQKFHFLVGLYVDKVQPNLQALMHPFVQQANSLSTRGVIWKPDGVHDQRSIFVPFSHTVDAAARNEVHNMAKYNSYDGCTYCLHPGVWAGNYVRFPVFTDDGVIEYEERTHLGMLEDMIEAHETGEEVRGHYGMARVVLMNYFNLRDGQGCDDLHPDHEGCAADVTNLILTLAPRVPENLAHVNLLHLIDQRLLSIKTPSRISRKPVSMTSRGSFKGTEWRNWLFFYSVPCLTGLIHPQYVDLISMLSYGCYLLSQDVIEPADVDTAERLLRRYAVSFQERFGIERIKFNLHVTTAHKANAVRKLGPPWAHSTYNFESLIQKVVSKVTSPKGVIMQVVTRFLLHQTVNHAMYDDDIPEFVRERIKEVVNKQRLQGVHQVGAQLYLIGRATRRQPSPEEHDVLVLEGIHIDNFEEYGSFLKGSTRYKSVRAQNEDIKSDDSFIYTSQDTYCTIQKVILYQDENGEEHAGIFVIEHSVARILPIARHIFVLRDRNADVLHYVSLEQVRYPGIKVSVGNITYAMTLPNCFEID